MSETLNTLGLKLIASRVIEERDRLSSILAVGQAVKSFEEYKFFTGQIKALGDVLVWCGEAEKDLLEGKK